MNYFSFAFAACLIFIFCGCNKDSEIDNCIAIKKTAIVVEKDSVNVGDEIYLRVNDVPVTAFFNWTHSNIPNDISTSPEVRIHAAEKGDEGWYYMHVSHPDCSTRTDSVYITVKNKPAVAPCSPANNAVTFSSIPDISPATVKWSFDLSWNRRLLEARGAMGYPDFRIYFNTFWDNKEPEDGEYSIVNMSATGEYPPYTVYISSLYSGILFQAGSGKVYVSHVNNKLRVTFCNIPLTGSSGGPAFNTTASGALTAP